jgi:ketosteroid isomerase-like protein
MAFGPQFKATGLDAARHVWLDFFEPWQSFPAEVERIISAGDKVVVLSRQHRRMTGAENEVETISAAVYLVRKGRIARAEFYAKRAEALDAVGLRE